MCVVVGVAGYNIEEFLDLEKLGKQRPSAPMVIINGNLDRVKSGYYPPIFYPQLNNARGR